jgi:hypothetical protein
MISDSPPFGYAYFASGIVFMILGGIQLFAPADILLSRPASDFRFIADDNRREPRLSEPRISGLLKPEESPLWDRELDGLP